MACGGAEQGFWRVTNEVEVAARSHLPVLVTGQPAWVLEVVRVIAQRANRHVTVVPCDPSGGQRLVGTVAAADQDDIVWAREVGRLDRRGQQTLLEFLKRPGTWRQSPQLVASSSVELHARVRAGEFDDDLFYALNAIHIIEP